LTRAVHMPEHQRNGPGSSSAPRAARWTRTWSRAANTHVSASAVARCQAGRCLRDSPAPTAPHAVRGMPLTARRRGALIRTPSGILNLITSGAAMHGATSTMLALSPNCPGLALGTISATRHVMTRPQTMTRHPTRALPPGGVLSEGWVRWLRKLSMRRWTQMMSLSRSGDSQPEDASVKVPADAGLPPRLHVGDALHLRLQLLREGELRRHLLLPALVAELPRQPNGAEQFAAERLLRHHLSYQLAVVAALALAGQTR